jgi:hypothetical protein
VPFGTSAKVVLPELAVVLTRYSEQGRFGTCACGSPRCLIEGGRVRELRLARRAAKEGPMERGVSTAKYNDAEIVRGASPALGHPATSGLTVEAVWDKIAKASFAVVSYVTPDRRAPIKWGRLRRPRALPVHGRGCRQLEGAPGPRRLSGCGDRTRSTRWTPQPAGTDPAGNDQLPCPGNGAPGGLTRRRLRFAEARVAPAEGPAECRGPRARPGGRVPDLRNRRLADGHAIRQPRERTSPPRRRFDQGSQP